MTPQERYAEIAEQCRPVMFNGVPIMPTVDVAAANYLLARVRRAEELLRDLGRVYDNHGGTQEINVFLTENEL